MALFFNGKDIFDSAEFLGAIGKSTLILAAVNTTRVNSYLEPLEYNSRTKYEFGSMSAGTSLKMAERYPGVPSWWAEKVAKGCQHGVHIFEEVRDNLIAGVATVKDYWWQEAPQDEARMTWIIQETIHDIDVIARFGFDVYSSDGYSIGKRYFDYICVPLLGTGYGNMDRATMAGMMRPLPENVLVFSR